MRFTLLRILPAILTLTFITALFGAMYFLFDYTGERIAYHAVSGETIYVGGSGAGNFSSIQEAITKAGNDDRIFIYSGHYRESVVINGSDPLSLKIVGESLNDTFIEGSWSIKGGEGFKMEISNLTFLSTKVSFINSKNFKVYNCIFENCSTALSLGDSENFRIYQNNFLNNYFGILLNDSTALIYHNNFINNTVPVKSNHPINLDFNGEGNYWDAYLSKDSDNDGIYDLPLKVENATDNFPLTEKSLWLRVQNLMSNAFFVKIQSAINDAKSGDIIKIRQDIYNENIMINSETFVSAGSLTLLGEQAMINDPFSDRDKDCLRIVGRYNIKISGLSLQFGSSGIRLEGLVSASISDCSARYNDHGIYIISSEHIVVTNTNISENVYDGLHLSSVRKSKIQNCTIRDNGFDGLYLYNSYSNLFNYNTFMNNYWGVYNLNSHNNTFYYNNFIENQVHAFSTNDVRFDFNSRGNFWSSFAGIDYDRDGISDIKFSLNRVTDAFPILGENLWLRVHNLNQDSYYLRIQEAIDSAENGDVIEVSAGEYHENLLISPETFVAEPARLTLDGVNAVIISHQDKACILVEGNYAVTISNFTLMNGREGIYLKSGRGTILNNVIMENTIGIKALESEGNNISNNNVMNNQVGILLDGTRNDSVLGNIVALNNESGIILRQGKSIKLENNDILNNSIGLVLNDSTNTEISNSSFHSISLDFQISNGSELMIVNSTFKVELLSITDSNLILKNYLDVKVVNAAGIPLQNAVVEVKDSFSAFVKMTGNDGFARNFLVTNLLHENNTFFEIPIFVNVSLSNHKFHPLPRVLYFFNFHTETFVADDSE